MVTTPSRNCRQRRGRPMHAQLPGARTHLDARRKCNARVSFGSASTRSRATRQFALSSDYVSPHPGGFTSSKGRSTWTPLQSRRCFSPVVTRSRCRCRGPRARLHQDHMEPSLRCRRPAPPWPTNRSSGRRPLLGQFTGRVLRDVCRLGTGLTCDIPVEGSACGMVRRRRLSPLQTAQKGRPAITRI